MFGMTFGFAVIKKEDLTEGIMPKRQVVGTGVTTSVSQATTSQTQATSNPPANSNPPASSTVNIGGNSTPVQSSAAQQSSVVQQQSTTQRQESSTQRQPVASSSSTPATDAITTTNSNGSKVTSHTSTNTRASAGAGAVATKKGKNNSVVKVGTSTIDPKTLHHPTTITSALLGKATEHKTFTSYWTSNGHVYSSVVTEDNVVSRTTGVLTATINPSLADGGGNGSNLTTQTKSIIGGVVGGIGGAILIGGLAFVAWRLWGKKRREEDVDDFNSNDSITQEKSHRGSGMTLDSEGYSNPGGRVNTASNF